MQKYFFSLVLIISLSSYSMTPQKFNKLRIKFKNNSLNDNDCKYMNSTLSDNNLNATARFYINSMLSNICFFKKRNYVVAHMYATNAYNCSNSACEISKKNILHWLNFTAQHCPCFQDIKNENPCQNLVQEHTIDNQDPNNDDLEIIIKNEELNF